MSVVGLNPNTGSATAPTLILDQLATSAVSAYGLRKLRAAYAGKCINVRRSSDNTTQDIGFTPFGDLDVTALLTFVGSGNSGFVATWYDQAGSQNVTQGTNANQPRIVNAGVVERTTDGNLGINFGISGLASAVGLYATSATYTLVENYSVIANSSGSQPNHYQCVVTSNDNGNGFGNCQDIFGSSNHWYPSDTNTWNNCSFSLPPISHMTGLWSGITQQLRDVVGNSSFKGLVIGNCHSGMPNPVNDASAWVGWVSELVAFGSSLSSGDRATLYANQANYFKILSNTVLSQIPASTTLAFSMRLLNANYTGKCLNVRRDSDNTTQDIGFTGKGNIDTVALLAFVGSANGYVTKWYDQSSFGLDAAQATAANQPRLVNAGTIETINSLPVIRFGLSSSVVLTTGSESFQANAVGDIYAVCAVNGTGFDPTNNPTVFSLNTGASFRQVLYGDHNTSTWDPASWLVSVNGSAPSGSSVAGVMNGALQVVNITNSSATGFGDLSSGADIGNINSVAGYTFFNGWIGELIVFFDFSSSFTSARTAMYNNQKAYWGTS